MAGSCVEGNEASILLGHVCLVYKYLYSVSSPLQCSYVQMQERNTHTFIVYTGQLWDSRQRSR